MNSEDRVSLQSPQDYLAALPYLVQELPPTPGLAVLAMKGPTVDGVFCCPLRGAEITPQACAASLIESALTRGCDGFLMVGFGAGNEVTRYLEALINGALAHGMKVVEALRVHQGRYWSLVCGEIECCPPEGTAVDLHTSAAPAEFTLRGLIPSPDPVSEEERCRRALAPYQVSAETVQKATAAAQERIERVTRQGHTRLLEHGQEAIAQAIAAQAEGHGPTDITELVNLAVLVRDLRVRDSAWILIGEAPQACRELWTKVTRAVGKSDRAAPAALAAVAAWCEDDITLARAAVKEALKATPGYAMAVLIQRALDWGISGQMWIEHVAEKLNGQRD